MIIFFWSAELLYCTKYALFHYVFVYRHSGFMNKIVV
nr:MAG TPA: hypothetical protein [Caudoviricetes sp.]